MYKRILVPTEGTGFDREAIRVALRMAQKSGAELHLVRVISAAFPSITGGESAAVPLESNSAEHDIALGDLYSLAAECREITDSPIVTGLESGPIGDALFSYATRFDADLFVLSSHGRHGIARTSLGSVADSLIRHVHIPVLLVKRSASYLSPRPVERFSRIVVPLDASAIAEQIIPETVRLAKIDEAEIVLVKVITRQMSQSSGDVSSAWWEQGVTQGKAYLMRVARIIRESGIPVTTEVVVGENVGDAISEFAGRQHADLIAIATHGRGGLARLIRGSVADELTRSAQISMLILRPEASKQTAMLLGLEPSEDLALA